MSSRSVGHCVVCFVIIVVASLCVAQAPEDDLEGIPTGVRLDLPEQVELRLLISLVSEQLGIQIIHDDKVGSQRVTIKTPNEVPMESLRGILESALQMNGLALVEDEQPGWYRVVEAQELTRISRPPPRETPEVSDERFAPTTAVTQVFQLQHADPQRVDQVIRSFLTQPGGNTVLLGEQDLLIITDYMSNLERIEQMVKLLDRPGKEVDTRFFTIEHMTASEAGQELQRILTARRAAAGQAVDRESVQVVVQDRTNQLVLIGPPQAVAIAESLVEPIDVPLGLETRTYRLLTASAQQVDQLTQNLIGDPATRRLYRSVIDDEIGLLVVTTTPSIHEQVASLVADLDVQMAGVKPIVRFYRLANTKAEEVLATLSEIEGSGGIVVTPVVDMGPVTQEQAPETDGDERPEPVISLPYQDPNEQIQPATGLLSPLGFESDRARVVADPNTNTLIVVAEPSVQEAYADLIDQLDQRRPQVLVEVTLVALDTSDSFSLGVELLTKSDSGDTRSLFFSSFGLSEVDPDAGSLTITPGIGFNGVVINADIADIVIRALAANGRAKVVSAPKILVNDNATGTLTAANDAPYASINASNTVSTTSFGGFESAGTTINVTPHISEDDHLNLEYSITLSSFTGDSGEGIPPPRQRSEVASVATIPDGDTIIVGGINRKDFSETINRVPLLGHIPGIEYLFSSRTKTDAETTLFVFIRPVILRDDLFRDLKYLSASALDKAGLPPNDPQSQPLMIQ